MGTPLLHVSANVQNLSNVLLPFRVDPAAWRFERQQWVESSHSQLAGLADHGHQAWCANLIYQRATSIRTLLMQALR